MKVLFLDIDGVINTVGGEQGMRLCVGRDTLRDYNDKKGRLLSKSEFFDPACLYYLKEIVVSSTWRLGIDSVDDMKDWFSCPEIRDAIIGWTPTFYSTSHPELKDRRGRVQRGEEIKYWLNKHPEVTHYAILDDDSDMDVVYENFFKTDSFDGLKRETAYKVITHLNRFKLDHYRMDRALTRFLSEYDMCFKDLPSTKNERERIVESIKKLIQENKDR